MKIAGQRFASTDDAREGLRKAIAEISDDQLRFAEGTRIIVVA